MKLTGTIRKTGLSGTIGKSKGGSALSDHIFALMENNCTAAATETVSAAVDYTTAESLSFDGTQYVATDFKPTNNTKIEIDFMRTAASGQKFLFGSRSSGAHFALMYQSTMAAYPMFGTVISSMSDTGATVDAIHTAALGQDGYYLDDEQKKTFEDMSFTGVYDLYIGTANYNGDADNRLFVGSIYAVRIYESGVLVHEFLPAVSADGREGLYDIVGLQFYAMQTI